jgi:alpha-mannosidase
MVYEKYSNRVLDKLENLNKIYANLMYTKIASLDPVLGMQTKDHLRTPPTDGLSPLKSGDTWGGEYMNLWVKGSFTVPAELDGKKLFVIPHTNAYETLFFKNGIPDGIFNSKGDYMGIMHSAQLICEKAVAGQTF